MNVDVQLPSTAGANVPAVLLGHQQSWIADESQLKVVEKGRRTGVTWAEAADCVLIASSSGGQNIYYTGYNQDMAVEFIDACAMWARAFNHAAGEIEEGLWDDGEDDRHIKTYTIRFPDSSKRIVALSSRPANLRGRQGVVVIDEAAFHDNLDELLKAAMALLIWGGKVRVISTHNGEENPFNELIREIRSGKRKGTVHHYSFRDAVGHGLYKRVCLRLGRDWHQDEERAWVDDVYAFYGDDAEEELDVIPKAGGGAYLSIVLIEGRMVEVPVVRLEYEDEFADRPDHARHAECQAFLDENIAPLLEALPKTSQHYFGQDFARSGDLSVLAPFTLQANMVRHVPFLLEMRNVPFRQQEQILFFIADRLPRFMGGALDARGNGQALAEYARQRYGAARIDEVMLSQAWYREHMPRFKAGFEDQHIEVPRDEGVRSDLRAVVMERGVAKVPDSVTTRGPDGKPRHGDSAIALALGYSATFTDRPAIEFTPVPSKATRWDPEIEDHDEDDLVVAGKGGAW